MSDAMMPSWRVRPQAKAGTGWGIPRRVWWIGGGSLLALALVAGGFWGYSKLGPRGVPLIEADGRPFKVRPDSPGGAVVANQSELIFERGAARTDRPGEARLTAGPEAPRLDALRAQGNAAPTAMPAPATTPAAAPAAPSAAPSAPAVAQQPARPAAAQGRVQVQLLAARSEEAARTEWDRLARRAPELAGRSPVISRLDRPEGQAPLFRLRTGGFADPAAARAFCEQIKARQLDCMVIPG
jgi:hypothetical protein